eukprot:4315030-Pleurochrysis_carterae.AAC.1
MQAAVSTMENDACKSLVDLQTLSQRLAALVADALTICMQMAGYCRGVSNDGQEHDHYIGSVVWTYKQRCVHERLML